MNPQSASQKLKSIIATTLVVIAAVTVITACSQKPTVEESAAQSKAIADQAVVEAKKEILAEQAAEKNKQDAIAAEQAAEKSKQEAIAVAQAEEKSKHKAAVAEAKKQLIAEQRSAEEKARSSRSYPDSAPIIYSAPVQKTVCNNCGVVQSVNKVETEGQGSGLGVVAGGVVGGLVGNQVGNGTGRDLATIAGVVGGAFAGNKIEKNSKKTISYDIVIKMDSGVEHKVHQSSVPNVAAGDKVRIENNAIVRN